MDEHMIKKEVIPFSIDSRAAWHSVLKYFIQKEDTPVDIACGSRFISCEMMYYPVERGKINYEAQWQAESIFIKQWTEMETCLKKEVHYFDRFGTEHEHPGFDYLDPKTHKWRSGTFNPITSRARGYSGSTGTRPWQPLEVTVEETREVLREKETGRENSSGTVKDSEIEVFAERYPFFKILYGNYKNGKERVPYSDEELKTATVDGVVLINGSQQMELINKAKDKAEKQCIGRIPGQKYRNFQMEFIIHDMSSEIWYYPAYKIVYMYQNETYECLVSGCTAEAVYETVHPTDNNYSNILSQVDIRSSELINQRKKSTKTIAIALIVEVISVLLAPLYFLLGTEGFLQFIFWFAVMIGNGYFIYKEFLKRKKFVSEKENVHKEKDNLAQNRRERKKKIFDIMTDDSLNDDEKRERCRTLQ